MTGKPRLLLLNTLLCLSVAVICSSPVQSQSRGQDDQKRKVIRAIKVNSHGIKLDGKLNDDIWLKAKFSSDFLQKEPVQGGQPSEKTEVAIAYDETAVYVAARMYSKNPNNLSMYLDRRDSQGPTEQFIVTFDTYLDRRTAYGFGVNTSGVRFDRYNPQDDEFNRTYSYNPVWEARTSRDDVSWMVEMRIPFSQLRFLEKEEQLWGVNFNRWIPDRNEDIYWIYVPRDETGWSSYFGNLVGIENVKPSRRIELLPYFAGDGNFQDNTTPGDPFNDGSSIGSRIGGDFKMGLGPNLTLDATINPDFGQVEADAAVVNLSAFETFFPEKRPFFTEGSQLLNPHGPSYFYSRRVGASPHGSAGGDFVDRPRNTTILGAAKITGRLGSGTSISVLGAVTGREYAKSYNQSTQATTEVEIEPTTFYAVAGAEQEFGKNSSTLGFVITALQRSFDDQSQFNDILNKKAFSGGANWNYRMKGGEYQIRGYTGFSYVQGSRAKITSIQRSSAHYFQRPDADYVELDTTRTSLAGYTSKISFEKRSGKHWRGDFGIAAESPGFELNDAGILGSADDIDAWTWLQYRETTPGKLFRNWNVNLNTNHGWNYGAVRQYRTFNTNFNFQLKNFWWTWFGMNRQTRGQSDSRTRGGPVMSVESGWSWFAGFSNNGQKSTTWNFNGNYGIDELNGYLWSVSGSFSTRIGTNWKFSLNPRYTKENQPRQYVTTVTEDISGNPTTGGTSIDNTRYVFARIARRTISMQIRTNYFISPDLSIELYAEPFVANGRFYDHGELATPGTHDLLFYDENGRQISQATETSDYIVTDGGEQFSIPFRDFSALSFRSNLVMRWEFFPGSTLFLVWQRSLSDNFDSPGRKVNPGDLFSTLEGSGQDFVAMKVAYWIPFK